MPDNPIDAFLASDAGRHLAAGPIAVVIDDPLGDAMQSAADARARGVAAALVLTENPPPDPAPPEDPAIHVLNAPIASPAARAAVLNRLIGAFPGCWFLWLQAGENFYFPFCETRTLSDLIGFLTSERRASLYCYEIDLYGRQVPALGEEGGEAALYLDRSGYYAFPGDEGALDSYGGLGWRFEEFFEGEPQPIARPALFLARPGLALSDTLSFADPAYHTVACPWHHNPTGAVVSLRRARRLMAAPGFGAVRDKMIWRGSVPYEGTSRQLLELGLIEPGQWF